MGIKSKNKKSNLGDFKHVSMQHNVSAAYDDDASSDRKNYILTSRNNESQKAAKRLVKIKSVNEFKTFKRASSSLFTKRKKSCGPISTDKLCHLPKECAPMPQTNKASIVYGNYEARLRKVGIQNKGSKSKSYTDFRKVLEKGKNSKRSLRSKSKSISRRNVKKISSTKQPSKPNDIKFEPCIENEGTSFNSLKTNIKSRVSPSNGILDKKKNPISYLEGRKLSIQLDLFAKTDNK